MPRIPIFTANPNVPSSRLRASGADIALGSATGLAAQNVELTQRLQRQRENVQAAQSLSRLKADFTRRFREAQQNAEEGAPNFTDTLLAEFDSETARAFETVPESQRDNFALSTDEFRLGLEEKANVFEAASRGTKLAADAGDIINTNANILTTDPDSFDSLLTDTTLFIEGLDIPAPAKRALLDDAKSRFAVSRISGVEDTQGGQAALDLIDSGTLDPFFDGREKEAARNSAEVRIRQEQAEARARQAEALAILTGEVRDAITVLGAGRIPPGLVELQGTVAGTELAEPLEDAIADRDTVEDFLRQPLADQSRDISRLRESVVTDRRALALEIRLVSAHTGLL